MVHWSWFSQWHSGYPISEIFAALDGDSACGSYAPPSYFSSSTQHQSACTRAARTVGVPDLRESWPCSSWEAVTSFISHASLHLPPPLPVADFPYDKSLPARIPSCVRLLDLLAALLWWSSTDAMKDLREGAAAWKELLRCPDWWWISMESRQHLQNLIIGPFTLETLCWCHLLRRKSGRGIFWRLPLTSGPIEVNCWKGGFNKPSGSVAGMQRLKMGCDDTDRARWSSLCSLGLLLRQFRHVLEVKPRQRNW